MATKSRAVEVLEEALELKEEERLHIAYMLLHSTEAEEERWYQRTKPEIDRISAAIDSGEMATSPLAEVQQRLRERLARHAD